MTLRTIPIIGPQTLEDNTNKPDITATNNNGNSPASNTNTNSGISLSPADKHTEVNPDTIIDQQKAVKEEATDSYTPDNADSNLETLKTRQNTVIDSIDPERMFEDYNTNLTWENPRGQYNAKSYADTLALSRAADARNNRLVRKPNNIGGYYLGGNSVQPTFNEYTKMPQIETEEMRAMDANRKLDYDARKAQEELQAKIQAYNFELQRMSDSQKLQLMYQIGYDEHKFEDMYRRLIAEIGFKEYSESKMRFLFDRMRQELGLYMNQEVANSLMDAILNGNGAYANVYAGLFAPNPMPEATQIVLQRATDYLFKNYGNSPNLMAMELALRNIVGTMASNATSAGMRQSTEATIGGLGNGPRNPYDANDK